MTSVIVFIQTYGLSGVGKSYFHFGSGQKVTEIVLVFRKVCFRIYGSSNLFSTVEEYLHRFL
jgi:hypothetical protein